MESSLGSMIGATKESPANKPCLINLSDERIVSLSTVCSMYYMAMSTLTQMKMDILTGKVY